MGRFEGKFGPFPPASLKYLICRMRSGSLFVRQGGANNLIESMPRGANSRIGLCMPPDCPIGDRPMTCDRASIGRRSSEHQGSDSEIIFHLPIYLAFLADYCTSLVSRALIIQAPCVAAHRFAWYLRGRRRLFLDIEF
jgi:hypothetical protein